MVLILVTFNEDLPIFKYYVEFNLNIFLNKTVGVLLILQSDYDSNNEQCLANLNH